MNSKTITLGLTGASGIAYGLRLLELLLKYKVNVNLIYTKPAQIVASMESNIILSKRPKDVEDLFIEQFKANKNQLRVYNIEEWTAPIASGSDLSEAMVVCPCTAGTLAGIATGMSRNLLERAADVILKEARKLILVVRETPFSVIHLENMLKLAKMGAVVLPPNPGFYNHPQSIEDLIDFIVARILDQLEIKHDLISRWGH